MKKVVYIFLAIVIVGGTCTLLYFLSKLEKNVKEEPVFTYSVKTNEMEVYTKYHLSDFIEGDLVEDYEIFETELGDKTYDFSYKVKEEVINEKVDIKVVDTTSPVAILRDSYTLYVNSTDDLTMKIVTADNYDSDPKKEIIGEYNRNVIGEYPLEYKITDSSGNETSIPFTLKVKEQPKNSSSSSYIRYGDIITKHKNENTKIGIDVSKWQGNINFNKIKNAGVEFMFIRVGTQTNFHGVSIEDSYFKKNITGANNSGIDAGIYYYSYATSKEEAHEQALWVLSEIKDYNIQLPIVFDWESFGSFNGLKMNIYNFNEIANEFFKVLNENGYQTMLYGSKNYLEKIWKPESLVWLAHYTDETDYSKDYYVWQLCNNGRVDGIGGNVDIDVMYLKSE